ncbi:MAG: hypothetical protein BMS9Abin26_1401 [Gammaproteobacteria bacterium]|nr:MAG: hypothetical protein BMS9Abin26_1401 [Gammaproteobacteria bacterium]
MDHWIRNTGTKIMIMIMMLNMISTIVSAADYVYVSDELRVGVRPNPGRQGSATSVVTTGMRLEILEQRGNYLRIRTDKGKEGWVKKTYTTTQAPAAVRLKKLQQQLQSRQPVQQDQAQNKSLLKEISSLKEASSQYRDQILDLTQQLEQASNASVTYKQEMERQADKQAEQLSTTSLAAAQSQTADLWWVPLVILISIVAGFFLGAQWFKRYTMKKLGGLNI